jgi:tRNA(fMet)-specific endonuclease VapC
VTRKFMLDTDTVSFVMKGVGRAAEHIVNYLPEQLCISVITLGELRHGAMLRNSTRFHRFIDAFTRTVVAVPFDESCAAEFARIATNLTRAGARIGDLDILIAAHALTLDVTLVTNNVKHFNRVRGLRVENWL